MTDQRINGAAARGGSWILIVAIMAMLILTVVALTGGCQRERGQQANPDPPADNVGGKESASASPIEIVVFKQGRSTGSITLSDGDASYKEISDYIHEASTANGEPTRASHAPGLLVSSGNIRINFLDERVVVSKRHDAEAVWEPLVRSKSDSDRITERVIRERFDAAGIPRNKAEAMIEDGSIRALDRDGLVAAFGQPNPDGYFSEWDNAFWLGVPEDTYGVDSHWLVVNYGDDGCVQDARVVMD